MSAALLLTGGLILLVAGIGHLVAPGSTASLVVAHGLLRPGWAATVSRVLPVVEIVLGVGLLYVVATGSPGLQRALGSVALVLFAALAAYAHLAWRARPARPPLCACGVAESPLGPWVTARALLLAVFSGVGAWSAGHQVLLGRPPGELVIVGCATITLTLVLLYLPASRALLEPVTIGRA